MLVHCGRCSSSAERPLMLKYVRGQRTGTTVLQIMCVRDGLGKSPRGNLRGSREAGVRASSPDPPKRPSAAALGGAAVEPDTGDGSGSDHSQGRKSAPGRSVHEWGAKPRPQPKARAKGFARPQGPRPGPARAGRQARPSAVSEGFCPRVCAGGPQAASQRAVSRRRTKASPGGG